MTIIDGGGGLYIGNVAISDRGGVCISVIETGPIYLATCTGKLVSESCVRLQKKNNCNFTFPRLIWHKTTESHFVPNQLEKLNYNPNLV